MRSLTSQMPLNSATLFNPVAIRFSRNAGHDVSVRYRTGKLSQSINKDPGGNAVSLRTHSLVKNLPASQSGQGISLSVADAGCSYCCAIVNLHFTISVSYQPKPIFTQYQCNIPTQLLVFSVCSPTHNPPTWDCKGCHKSWKTKLGT